MFVCRALRLVGTLPRVNVFRVSASDLLFVTDMILDLPNYTPGDDMTVIVNVMFDDDYTGPYQDPSGRPDSNRTLATSINMVGLGVSGLFNDDALVRRIIWNFPHATYINMSYIGFRGSLLAPDAGVVVIPGL